MNSIIKQNRRRPLIISLIIALLLLILFCAFLLTEYHRETEKKINSVTHDYIRFQNLIENFVDNNINLMTGLSAYIKSYEQFDDKDIYTYIANLTENNTGYIKNIGILEDTTIKWNYPSKGNEKAIGVDLSKVPDQASSIEYVKTYLKYSFDGPKQLVQGGTGYIIRMPLLRDGVYWGMVSIVLDADNVQELFSQYAKECDLKVAIVNRSSEDKLIFGDSSIIGKKNFKFDSAFAGNQWSFYVIPSDTQITNFNYLLLLALFGFILILLVVRFIYFFLSDAEKIREKNDMLNSVIFRDRLTGIYNRSYLDIRIQEETDLSSRYGTPLSIIYFDLDHFKLVNDNCGHIHGDAVLKKITSIVGANLRSNDFLARWGGEEFAVLMPAIPLSSAVKAAEKIRSVIEAIEFPYVDSVTASFGVAEYFPDEYIGSWFKRVDNALYQSKKDGRNRVTASEIMTEDISVQHRIRWRADWYSGNSTIDTDHKELLQLGNHLVEDSYNFNTVDEFISRYNALLDHIMSHIEREEKILEGLDYEGINSHKMSHQRLLEEATTLREKFKDNKIDAQILFNFLMQEVAVGHLTKEDTKFFPFLS